MRETIKRVMHSNHFFERVLQLERKIQYYYVPVYRFKSDYKKRKAGKNNIEAYERIKTIKDKHNGERCFIVCTGPSLTREDLLKIKNEYTFGMNSIALMDDWRPSYFGIQDTFVYKKMPEAIRKIATERPTFVTSSIYFDNEKEFKGNQNVYLMPVFCSDHLINPESDEFRFSTDCYLQIHDGFSITISLIQIAYYMGFREIYLIGADCNYSQNGKNHFIEYGLRDPYAHKSTNRNIRMYEKVKEFADQNGLSIYNATRGGMLEVFPRVCIDEMKLK